MSNLSEDLSQAAVILSAAFGHMKPPESSVVHVTEHQHEASGEVASLKAALQGKEWSLVDPTIFANCSTGGVHSLTDESFIYYLPLFALSAIKNSDSPIADTFKYCLSNTDPRYHRLLESLASGQRSALGECLLVLLDYSYGSERHDAYYHDKAQEIMECFFLPSSKEE